MSRLFTCMLVTCRELSRFMDGQSELTNWYSSLMSASSSLMKELNGETRSAGPPVAGSRRGRSAGAGDEGWLSIRLPVGMSKVRCLWEATSRSKSEPKVCSVSTSSRPCTVSATSASYGRLTKCALVPNTLSTEM